MEVRHPTDPENFKRMTTEDLRRLFLIDSLFKPDQIETVYSTIDRSIIGSAVPVREPLILKATKKEMAAEYFAERREIGVINIGGAGKIFVDGTDYPMAYKDALYIGRGAKAITFASTNGTKPAAYYLASYPAHMHHPTTHASCAEAEAQHLGSRKEANERTIHRYIHLKGILSCQLVMGLTELEEGSVWNTMPAHTHERRSEVYMYFNLDPSAVVVHLLGEPSETRHLVIRDRQAVLSPSWSIHSGVGSQAYTFIWAMGGENQVFDDMDHVPMQQLI